MSAKCQKRTLTQIKVLELFSDGEILESIDLYRRGAFRQPMRFPFQVSLQPGFRVFDEGYPLKLVIERDGKIIKNV